MVSVPITSRVLTVASLCRFSGRPPAAPAPRSTPFAAGGSMAAAAGAGAGQLTIPAPLRSGCSPTEEASLSGQLLCPEMSPEIDARAEDRMGPCGACTGSTGDSEISISSGRFSGIGCAEFYAGFATLYVGIHF